MAEPTKQEQDAAAAAKAKAEQDAKARAAEPPKPADTTAALAEAVRNFSRVQAPAAPTEDIDKTVRGGKYLVNKKLVNANGREIDEDGKLLHPEEQRVDAFGRLV
jgi:hypothetical protein